jgi:hypothetical protein
MITLPFTYVAVFFKQVTKMAAGSIIWTFIIKPSPSLADKVCKKINATAVPV